MHSISSKGWRKVINNLGRWVPQVCPAGKYGTIPPSEHCNGCPKGETSFQGSIQCQLCERGKYSAIESSPNCTLCNKNGIHREYNPTLGASVCLSCERGRTSTGTECLDLVDIQLPVPCNVQVLKSG